MICHHAQCDHARCLWCFLYWCKIPAEWSDSNSLRLASLSFFKYTILNVYTWRVLIQAISRLLRSTRFTCLHHTCVLQAFIKSNCIYRCILVVNAVVVVVLVYNHNFHANSPNIINVLSHCQVSQINGIFMSELIVWLPNDSYCSIQIMAFAWIVIHLLFHYLQSWPSLPCCT